MIFFIFTLYSILIEIFSDMKNTDSGSQLLQRINAREPKALEELYQLLFWPCAKVVTKDGGSLDEAKEVFHQAIFSLMIKLQSPDFSLKKNLKRIFIQELLQYLGE